MLSNVNIIRKLWRTQPTLLAAKFIWRRHLARISSYFHTPDAPVSTVAVEVIQEYAQKFGCKCFIETGTLFGKTTEATCDFFIHSHTIEIDPFLYKRSKKYLAGYPSIICHLGNSADVLPLLLPKVNEPILYWLDGHYSGGITGKGNTFTPIMQELNCISKHPYCRESVILIDNAREFNGDMDYPTIDYLKEFVSRQIPSSKMSVSDDIVRIYPIDK